MTAIYLDISQFLLTRKTTGIQRVIKEFLLRAPSHSFTLNMLDIDLETNSFIKLDEKELPHFFKELQNYQFKTRTSIDLYKETTEKKIFLELDTVWNAPLKRETLYPRLKQHGFEILNFIYDLIPLLFPHYLYKASRENFPNFIQAVYNYSDLAIFSSHSSQNDFLNLQTKFSSKRVPKTTLLSLGADYTLQTKKSTTSYQELLSKQFILFVGTIEPRKKQLQLLEVYEELQKKYPDLHLVFIGKIGWNVDTFCTTFSTHPLKNKTLHHLTNITDDLLTSFYKNAYLVSYLSKYEGYGLPLVESLMHHNITISSKNSSMAEFSTTLVDFVADDSNKALYTLLDHYLASPKKQQVRRKEIQKNYKPITWNDFYTNLIQIIENFDILTPLVNTKGNTNDTYK